MAVMRIILFAAVETEKEEEDYFALPDKSGINIYSCLNQRCFTALLLLVMGTDRGPSRGERSGRYGPDGQRDDPEWCERRSRDVERDCDLRWVDGLHDRERFDEYRDRRSPEKGRKRHRNDRSDDEYDGDYPEQQEEEEEEEEESKTIMLRGLSLHATEDDIRAALDQLPGPQPVDVRLMKKRTGISRGFAFVEFYHLQDSTRWMETNQDKLVVQGKNIAVHYSNRKQNLENWLCGACGLYNFRKRLRCFRCGGAREETPGVNASNAETQQPGEFSADTLIFRNVSIQSTVDGILTLLGPYANLSPSNIRLIKDKQTGQNRGFAFAQLSSALEASQLLTILQSVQPPLKLDGKTISVDFAKSARKDAPPQPETVRVGPLSVASTAIAAAQWSSSQLKQNSVVPSDYGVLPESFAQLPQEPNSLGTLAPVVGDGLLGAAPGMHTLLPAATGVVLPPGAQVYLPLLLNQRPMETLLVRPAVPAVPAVPAASLCTTAIETSPTSTAATTVSVAPKTSSGVPDTSMYQYGESSGYYYDPQTALYYDPSSQYYYNSETQQYLYWDSEQQTYIPALSPSDARTERASTAHAADNGCKERKEKPKNKSAQQIAKDMERWAKSMNKQKESFKNSFQGASKEDERKESAAADAGFSLLEKKTGGFEMPPLMMDQFKLAEPELLLKGDAVAAHAADSDPEEDDGKITDWTRMVCLLCRRQFPTTEALLRHQQLSDLHKQNMEFHRRLRLTEAELEELERKETELKYRDRAAERREKYGVPEPPATKKKKFRPPQKPSVNYEQPTKDGLTSDNIGNKMLQAMGWQEGKGLGRHQQGITAPISASLRTKGTGLGVQGSSYELAASDTYKDAARKAMFARFTEIE